MLAFDIETTGLDSDSWVTCVCAYDPDTHTEATFNFAMHEKDKEKCMEMREEFMGLMDEADRLCAFNGVRFDIPFMAQRWKIPAARVGMWVAKLFDPFEFCKLSMNRTFPLRKLLAKNNLEGKTGDGLEAIHMALNGEYEKLERYCMQDTRVTHMVCSLPCILLPEPHEPMCICIGDQNAPVQEISL